MLCQQEGAFIVQCGLIRRSMAIVTDDVRIHKPGTGAAGTRKVGERPLRVRSRDGVIRVDQQAGELRG